MGATASKDEVIVDLKLSEIVTNSSQPRTLFDQEKIEELAKSIKEHGVLQPIIVRKYNQSYQIVAGERRYRASLVLNLKTIPAIIREFSDVEAASIALVENIQREDLTAIEEARAYKSLMEMNQLKQEELANQLGKSQSTIANKIRLLNLPIDIQQFVLERKLTERHARALLTVKDEALQMAVVNEIFKKDLTVKQTETYIDKLLNKDDEKPKGTIIRKIPRDIRMAYNTINHAVSLVEQTGLSLEVEQEEDELYYTYHIKIAKKM